MANFPQTKTNLKIQEAATLPQKANPITSALLVTQRADTPVSTETWGTNSIEPQAPDSAVPQTTSALLVTQRAITPVSDEIWGSESDPSGRRQLPPQELSPVYPEHSLTDALPGFFVDTAVETFSYPDEVCGACASRTLALSRVSTLEFRSVMQTTLQVRSRLSDHDIKRLVSADSCEEVVDLLKSMYYTRHGVICSLLPDGVHLSPMAIPLIRNALLSQQFGNIDYVSPIDLETEMIFEFLIGARRWQFFSLRTPSGGHILTFDITDGDVEPHTWSQPDQVPDPTVYHRVKEIAWATGQIIYSKVCTMGRYIRCIYRAMNLSFTMTETYDVCSMNLKKIALHPGMLDLMALMQTASGRSVDPLTLLAYGRLLQTNSLVASFIPYEYGYALPLAGFILGKLCGAPNIDEHVPHGVETGPFSSVLKMLSIPSLRTVSTSVGLALAVERLYSVIRAYILAMSPDGAVAMAISDLEALADLIPPNLTEVTREDVAQADRIIRRATERMADRDYASVARTRVNEYRGIIDNYVRTQGMGRYTHKAFGLYLYGESGIGKTTWVNGMCKHVHNILQDKPPNFEPEYFTPTLGTQFEPNYDNLKTVCLCDDVLLTKETAHDFFSKLFCYVNVKTTPVNMAAVHEKGRFFYNFKVVAVISNTPDFSCQEILEDSQREALDNRFPYRFKASKADDGGLQFQRVRCIKPGVWRPGQIIRNGQAKNMFTLEEMPEELERLANEHKRTSQFAMDLAQRGEGKSFAEMVAEHNAAVVPNSIDVLERLTTSVEWFKNITRGNWRLAGLCSIVLAGLYCYYTRRVAFGDIDSPQSNVIVKNAFSPILIHNPPVEGRGPVVSKQETQQQPGLVAKVLNTAAIIMGTPGLTPVQQTLASGYLMGPVAQGMAEVVPVLICHSTWNQYATVVSTYGGRRKMLMTLHGINHLVAKNAVEVTVCDRGGIFVVPVHLDTSKVIGDDIGTIELGNWKTPYKNLPASSFKVEGVPTTLQVGPVQRDAIPLPSDGKPITYVVWGHQHLVKDYWSTSAQMANGDCGSLLYDADGYIIGMHVAASTRDRLRTYQHKFTKPVLQGLFKHQEMVNGGQMVPSQRSMVKQVLVEHGLEPDFSPEASGAGGRNKLVNTSLPLLCETTRKVPSLMTSVKTPGGTRECLYNPLATAAMKWCRAKPPDLEFDDFDEIADQTLAAYYSAFPMIQKLSIQQAYSGFYDEVTGHVVPGFPSNSVAGLCSHRGLSTKASALGKDGLLKSSITHTVKQHLAELEKGPLQFSSTSDRTYRAALKSEALVPTKQTRAFYIAPFFLTVLAKVLLAPFCAMVAANPVETMLGVGMKVTEHFQDIHQKLTSAGSFVAYDFSGFDMSVAKSLQTRALRIISIATGDKRILNLLSHDTLLAYDGHVVEHTHGLMSGLPGTSILGGLVQVSVGLAAMLRKQKIRDPEDAIDFLRGVVARGWVTYGDDGIAAPFVLTPQEMVQAYADRGLKMTGSRKGESLPTVESYPNEEAEFLGRTFHLSGNSRWPIYPRLRDVSFGNILSTRSVDSTDGRCILECTESIVREAALRSPQEYDRVADLVTRLARENQVPVDLRSYVEMLDVVFKDGVCYPGELNEITLGRPEVVDAHGLVEDTQSVSPNAQPIATADVDPIDRPLQASLPARTETAARADDLGHRPKRYDRPEKSSHPNPDANAATLSTLGAHTSKIARMKWAAIYTAGTVVGSRLLSPMYATPAQVMDVVTPAACGLTPFTYYHYNSAQITIVAAASSLATGVLRIFVLPPNTVTTSISSESLTMAHASYDLDLSVTHTIQFTVPWLSPAQLAHTRSWFLTIEPGDHTPVTPLTAGQTAGAMIVFMVLQPLAYFGTPSGSTDERAVFFHTYTSFQGLQGYQALPHHTGLYWVTPQGIDYPGFPDYEGDLDKPVHTRWSEYDSVVWAPGPRSFRVVSLAEYIDNGYTKMFLSRYANYRITEFEIEVSIRAPRSFAGVLEVTLLPAGTTLVPDQRNNLIGIALTDGIVAGNLLGLVPLNQSAVMVYSVPSLELYGSRFATVAGVYGIDHEVVLSTAYDILNPYASADTVSIMWRVRAKAESLGPTTISVVPQGLEIESVAPAVITSPASLDAWHPYDSLIDYMRVAQGSTLIIGGAMIPTQTTYRNDYRTAWFRIPWSKRVGPTTFGAYVPAYEVVKRSFVLHRGHMTISARVCTPTTVFARYDNDPQENFPVTKGGTSSGVVWMQATQAEVASTDTNATSLNVNSFAYVAGDVLSDAAVARVTFPIQDRSGWQMIDPRYDAYSNVVAPTPSVMFNSTFAYTSPGVPAPRVGMVFIPPIICTFTCAVEPDYQMQWFRPPLYVTVGVYNQNFNMLDARYTTVSPLLANDELGNLNQTSELPTAELGGMALAERDSAAEAPP